MRVWIRSLTIALLLAPLGSSFAGPVTKSGVPLPAYVDSIGADLLLAKAYEQFQANNLDACRAQLELVFEKHPNLPPVDLMMAQLLLRNNQRAAGKQLLENAAVANVNHPEVYLAFADLALAEGRYSDASLNVEQAAKLNPPTNWPDKQKASLRRHLFERRATVAERRQDWKHAEQVLQDWMTNDPDNDAVALRHAKSLFQLERPSDAMSELKRVEQRAPALGPAEVFMAGWHAEQDDLPAASKLLSARLKTSPRDHRVIVALAQVKQLQGEALEAWTLTERLGDQLDNANVRLLRGSIARSLGRIEVALPHAKAAYQESPDSFDASNLLCLLLAESKNAKDRLTSLRIGESNARQFPDNAAALAAFGWACFRNDRDFDAQQLLAAAQKLNPGDPETLYRLGVVCEARGKEQLADEMRIELRERLKENSAAFADRADAERWVNAN